jgi:hypothetical protein
MTLESPYTLEGWFKKVMTPVSPYTLGGWSNKVMTPEKVLTHWEVGPIK